MIPHAAPTEVRRFMRCTVAEQTYCLDMTRVRGIQRVEQLQYGTTTTSAALGWIVSGEQRVAVFSLAQQLRPSTSTPPAAQMAKIIILNTHPQPVAFLVDQLDGVIQVPAADLFPLPKMVRSPMSPFFDGVVQYADALMLSLRPEGLYPQATSAPELWQDTMQAPETVPTVASVPIGARGLGKVLCFTTADYAPQERTLTFALSISQVPQMLPMAPFLPVPGAMPYVLGLVAWRSCPLTVIDLSQRLGGPVSPVLSDSRLLVARASSRPAFVGFPVRPTVKMYGLPLAHRRSTHTLPWQESLLKGKFDLEGETLVIPDIDRLLVPSE